MFALQPKRLEPTELGEIVNKLIVEYFPDIVNVTFTAEMEGKLDDVEVRLWFFSCQYGRA